MRPKQFPLAIAILLLAGLAACASGGPAATPDGETSSNGEETPIAAAPAVDRIAIRTVDGAAQFYDTATGEAFVPRGVNYVDFYHNERGGYEDRVMATNVYDPERVRAAFQHLAEYGYNTVRVFFDTCGSGPNCIGNPNEDGLNPAYLDNMVDLLHIAAEEGIYVIFTANSVPENGGYWSYFDQQIYTDDQRYGFEDYRNADWLHPAGVEIKRRFWQDLMDGMVARQAPFGAVLGWELTNELWLWKDAPPLSLDEGEVTISNGQSYEMADPEQKRQMVVDGVEFYMDTIVPIIKAHDPEALTTVGFFAPQFPNPTGIGGDWYVDTAPLLEDSPVDFWDFHAYYDTDLSIRQQAENFGMIGYEEKPVVMGETGSGQEFFPSAYTGLTVGVRWIADSCAVGFDGWLNWGYYPWPEDLNGKPWTFLDQDELLLRSMAPSNQPDPCTVPYLEAADVALGRSVRYSRQLDDQPGANAVDGRSNAWSAGDYPPQWIEVTLDGPTTIQRVGMTISQWPPGKTRHQVWATRSDGQEVLVAEFIGFTTQEMSLAYDLPIPLTDVVAVRVLTLTSPSWVGWGEIEVISAPEPEQNACLGTAPAGAADLYSQPGDGSAPVSGLAAGEAAYLDGSYTAADGSRWRRVGAGLWAPEARLSLSGDCDSSALNGQPLEPTAPVTFEVSAPDGTGPEIFMGGDFMDTAIPTWQAYSVLLQRSGGRWTVTLDLPIGARISYLYTRNGWDTVEATADCGEMESRSIIVGASPITIQDEVAAWRDQCE